MSWQRIRGHDSLIQAFDQAVRRGRLAHAYLFVGPAGVGKRLFAGELAKALLCEARQEARLEACDHCGACKLVDAGTHPDLQIARRPDEKSEVPIDVVRELARSLDLKPARGRGKVVILDDADVRQLLLENSGRAAARGRVDPDWHERGSSTAHDRFALSAHPVSSASGTDCC